MPLEFDTKSFTIKPASVNDFERAELVATPREGGDVSGGLVVHGAPANKGVRLVFEGVSYLGQTDADGTARLIFDQTVSTDATRSLVK
ncbi:hypothetical protein [Shinella sp. M31]|uniref:hypothetical protein n=1 Tax=Shinella sp. M31 TaxID=3368615 RepID=UPI003BA3AF99